MALPLALLPWIELRFLKADGSVNANGTVETYEAGTSTPLETYVGTDPDVDAANPTTIDLDSDGRPPDPIFLLPRGYKFKVYDEDAALLYTIDDIEDVGAVAFATLANVLAEGARGEGDGYVITDEDNTVTFITASGQPCEVTLQLAADRGLPLTLINIGDGDLTVVRDGSDTFNGAQVGPLVIPAGTAPLYSGVTLNSDGTSIYFISALWGE